MGTIVKELVTKWTYKVDTSQIVRAQKAIKKVKTEMQKTQKASQTFGSRETKRINAVSSAWSKLRSQIRQTGTEYSRTGAKAGKANSKMGGGGFKTFALARSLGVGAGAAAGLAGGGLAAGITGISASLFAAGKKEQAEVGFEGFLQSGAKAKKLTEELTNFAAVTPLEINNVRDMATEILAMGGAYAEVIPILKKVGDVTGGNTERMQRALFNFLEVRNKQSADKVDLKQFVRAGIPIYQQLEKQLGKTKEQLYAMVSAGEITGKIISEAFTRMTSKGGKFEDRMEKMSKTFLGRLSNLSDAAIKLAEAIGGIFLNNGAGDFVWNLSLFIDGLTSAVKWVGELKYLMEGLIAVGAVLAAVFAPMTLVFAGLFLLVEDFIAFTQGRDSIFGRVFGKNGFFATLADIIQPQLDRIKEMWNKFLQDTFPPWVRDFLNMLVSVHPVNLATMVPGAIIGGIAGMQGGNNTTLNLNQKTDIGMREGVTPEQASSSMEVVNNEFMRTMLRFLQPSFGT